MPTTDAITRVSHAKGIPKVGVETFMADTLELKGCLKLPPPPPMSMGQGCNGRGSNRGGCAVSRSLIP